MVKIKVASENKHDKFRRIATARTSKILDNLRLLGNCSNTGHYSYSEAEITKIFSAIEKEMKRVKTLFNRPKTEFTLD